MDSEYRERVIFISGSTRGLGFHLATKFAEAGAKVAINGRSMESVNEVCKLHTNFFPAQCDLLNPEEFESLEQTINARFGQLDFVICNAGGGRSISEGTEQEKLNWFLDLNFHTTFNTIEGLRRLLAKKPDGLKSICVISSIAGHVPTSAPLGYSVAKAALNTLVSRMALVLSRDGIRINALSLGNLLYEGSTWESKMLVDHEIVKNMIANKVPLARFGTVDDVFAWCEFLGSARSSFATGGVFVVDGGQAVM